MHSQKLTRMLTGHRTAAIQAAMTERPEVALAALVHRPYRFSGTGTDQAASCRSTSRKRIENYLSHVSKDRILSMVTEAISPEKADGMRGLKKDQLVLRADEELSGLRCLPDNFKVIELQEKQ